MKIRSWQLGIIFLAVLTLVAIFVESLTGMTFDHQDPERILMPPGVEHWFGTDSLGRDLFTRVFYGARVSLFVAVFSSSLTMFLGVSAGAFAGWLGGWSERFLIRSLDVLQAIPSFLLVSLLCLFFQGVLPVGDFNLRSLLAVSLSISLVHWFNVAKVTRGLTRQIKALGYIEAARALGATPQRIFLGHILPNMSGTLGVLFVIQIPASILYESMISFAGYGLQSPQVSWGILLQEGWRSLSQFPHLLLLPALVLFLTVLSFQLIFFQRRSSRHGAWSLSQRP